MGIGLFKSSSSCICNGPSVIERVVGEVKKVITEKEEYYFEIVRTAEHNGYVIAELYFPKFKNYGGRKICVYRGTKKHLLNEHYLDPHFCEGKHLSPLARFVPTEEGWKMAMTLVKSL